MKRRTFMAAAGSAVTAPLVARAQIVGRLAKVGCLVSGSPASHGGFIAALRDGLVAFGHQEGRDFALDPRWADGRLERLPALAEDLARTTPDVVVTAIAAAAVAAKSAMPATPVVSATLTDPIGLGLVVSHARPGGTVTGILFSFDTLLGKQLELAREILPGASRFGMLVNMRNPSNVIQRRDAENAARTLGLTFVPVDVHSIEEIDGAFEAMKSERIDVGLVPGDAIFVTERQRIARRAAGMGLPIMCGLREFAEAGGLVSYGIDLRENWRRTAYFVDRILKGAKAADLPVEQPTKYELVINLKTAAALGLAIPPAILARADEVIE